MKVSELEQKIAALKAAHGDVEIETEYWCAECRDTHEGKGVWVGMVNGKMRMYVIKLGEE